MPKAVNHVACALREMMVRPFVLLAWGKKFHKDGNKSVSRCVYYDHMFSKYQVQPETEHYVCMVHMLGRAGKLREAYDFINNLPLASPQPGVWGALLSSCSYHGDVDMGREVAHILFALEPENVSYYVALCNMYVAAGRWEEAVELRTLIHDKQLKKPAGYSVIDVGLR
ncbi:pentatricopeptide repeat-containing protein mitochondrial-like [Dorcoceras hygrometricum]|uniref:Pentatricopeptide repeat-containing protein mitochondrial-like n=1 Tax=Dorcoceras hygrometricum TaxID=472368 RepID=A0A2Z7B0J3_9LAMI|nr:pentatricopeptide repeat-containing protein mitochondrial-like [Dorcoceras hygrometricum]